MQATLSTIRSIFKNSFKNFRRNDPLMLASSTAFFTTFSLSPILVILVTILGFFFRDKDLSYELFDKIQTTFGAETAEQIQEIVKNFRSVEGYWYITLGGFIFLLFVSTTLIKIVKQAIQHLWRIRRKSGNRFRYTLAERGIATAMIFFMGFLFIISLLLDTTVAVLQDFIQDHVPLVDVIVIRTLNIIFSLFVVTAWFSILYKILPDAHVEWKVALVGGLLTGVLFSLGKWILGKLLLYNNIVNIFGASASFALILLFIFYSAMILYFGACFTYEYGSAIHKPIKPGKYSNRFEVTLVENEEG